MMQVDTGSLVLVNINKTVLSVLLDVSVRLLIVLRSDDVRCDMLIELYDRRLVNDHKVDVLAGGSLYIVTGRFIHLSGSARVNPHRSYKSIAV